jgi:glycosyltransferase involved in cell wall biosynthesis
VTATGAEVTATGTESVAGLLAGRRICLVFEHSLSHYSRILLEMEGLRRAGAALLLVTDHPEDAPAGVTVAYRPLGPARRSRSLADATQARSPQQGAWRFAIRASRALVRRLLLPINAMRYRRTLRRLAGEVDLFWVIDFPRLESVLTAASGRAGVVYETVDLVPEYLYRGSAYRARCLAAERRLVGRVDGFITACDSYADYYMERYGDSVLRRRPVVRDNMPADIVGRISPTKRPIRLLFLGSLMADRPIMELIESAAMCRADVTLTFQGKNHLRDGHARSIAALLASRGLGDRVRFLDPAPPERIVEAASAFDVGIVALRGDDENERRASTGKLFTYMAAGLAIIGSDLPGISRIVGTHGNGLLVGGAAAAQWAAAIDRLAALDVSEIDAMKQRSLHAAAVYSWERQEPAFVGEFIRALSARPMARSTIAVLDQAPSR